MKLSLKMCFRWLCLDKTLDMSLMETQREQQAEKSREDHRIPVRQLPVTPSTREKAASIWTARTNSPSMLLMLALTFPGPYFSLRPMQMKPSTKEAHVVRRAELASLGFLNAFSFSVNVSELHVLCL